jgi:hypothetical protein
MHFINTAGTPSGLWTALSANVTAAMWNGIASSASIFQVVITPLDGTSATVLYTTGSGAQWTGSATGDWIPQVAGVISLRTNARGRQYRGRLFTPFISESVVSNGSFSATLAPTQTAWDNFRIAMGTSNYSWQIASYGHGLHKTRNSSTGVITLTPVSWTPHSTNISSNPYQQTLGTIRRRQTRLRP